MNPTNWFGKSSQTEQSVAAADPGEVGVNPLIPEDDNKVNLFSSKKDGPDNSVLIRSIVDLEIERTATGAIVYVEGLSTRQGAYSASLRKRESSDAGVLEYEFRVLYPTDATPVGSDVTRTLRAAVSLSNQDMSGIKLIRVVGAENAHETRRR